MLTHLFLHPPLWIVFIFTFLFLLIAFEGGRILGKKHQLSSEKEDKSPIGSIVAATLGLLAFLLAFSFSLGASRFDDRRKLVLEEANAIATTYLRAGYLSEPYQTTIKDLLKEYVYARLEAVKPEKLTEELKRSIDIQDQLWQQAVYVAEKNSNSVTVGLFIQSLNKVIDLHEERVNIGLYIRIPLIIWITLYFVTILALGSLGYQFGLVHAYHGGIMLLLILTFSSVIVLIADLDRPQEGFIKVSQQALVDLMNKLTKDNKNARS